MLTCASQRFCFVLGGFSDCTGGLLRGDFVGRTGEPCPRSGRVRRGRAQERDIADLRGISGMNVECDFDLLDCRILLLGGVIVER
jgi:hypothetical protein